MATRRGWTWKGSGGGQVGRIREGRRPPDEPSSSGRPQCCQHVPPLPVHTFPLTPGTTRELSRPTTAPEYVIPSHLFRVVVLERLQLPLPLDEALGFGCGCPACDEQRIEVLGSRPAVFRGSPIGHRRHSQRRVVQFQKKTHPGTPDLDGAALLQARRTKRPRTPNSQCKQGAGSLWSP